MIHKRLAILAAFVVLFPCLARGADNWPQFRGINSGGRANNDAKLPGKIGPKDNVIWKVKLAPGHSSPVVYGRRIYLTTVRDKKLFTVGIDRDNGKTLWERETPYKELEKIHGIGSHAQSSPATDGKRVVSFFGSAGMVCYDMDGKPLWKIKMGPFNNTFGSGTSPIIVGDRVILCQDHDTDSFLLAINKHTGKEIWRTDRSEFPRNYCSPIIWNVAGKKQIVVAATLRVIGYDFQSGEEIWTVQGISRAVCMTPVVGDDGALYVAGWAGGGDLENRIKVDPWDKFSGRYDKNKNGTLERKELTKGGPVERRFVQVDRDKTGTITEKEFKYYRRLFDLARNVTLAIEPGGKGDVTKTHVRWQFRRYVPFCASPLYANKCLFTVKDGGILTSLNAVTGKPYKTKRVSGTAAYYSSPVSGDGKVYLVDVRGRLTVVSAKGKWTVISKSSFGEDVYATPAIVGGRIYFRTTNHLYCFGLK